MDYRQHLYDTGILLYNDGSFEYIKNLVHTDEELEHEWQEFLKASSTSWKDEHIPNWRELEDS